MSNINLVRRFVHALEENDKTSILAFFNERSEFTNVPIGTAKGVEEIWQVLAPVHESAKSVRYVMHDIAESDSGAVLTERTDIYELADRTVEFRVMGIFHIEGDIIRLWRDYFDLKQSVDQMG